MNQAIRIICFLLFYGLRVQAADVLERHIDVHFQQTPLKEALATVARKAGFEWSYNANIVDAGKKISLLANDWTVRETLYELLGDGYEFKPNGQYLILKKRKKPAEQLSGYLKDPANGQRVANATVYDRHTLRATTTDSNGYYELRVKKSTQIAIIRLDYRDTIFPVTTKSPRFQKIDLQVAATPAAAHPLTLEESLQRAASQAERLFRASLEKWNGLSMPDSPHRRYQVSLLPRVGTNHTLSGKVVNDWSLNILAGISLGNRKLEVGGIGNFNRQNMTGLQLGGIFNELRGNAAGLQVGGIYNRVGDTLSGMQVGGIFNVANRTKGGAVQVGGISNFVRETQGLTVQVGGIVNQAPHSQVFMQVGGIANRAGGISGLQVAGIINTVDTLQGLQVAGIANRARKVKGLQIGLFNAAQELDGLQIGLLNRSGRRVLPFINW